MGAGRAGPSVDGRAVGAIGWRLGNLITAIGKEVGSVEGELAEVLELAQKMEADGVEYYAGLARQCGSPTAQRMFESFAADETRHLRIIKDVAKGLGVDYEQFPMPRDEIVTIFAGAGARPGDVIEATAGERDAIRLAMGMETKGFELYRDAAQRAQGEGTRQLLERLAREESQHYEMLENTLEYLSSNPRWFLWNEWALVVGDQSSLGSQ